MSMRCAAFAPLLMLSWAAHSEGRALSHEFLMGKEPLAAPVSMLEFTPPDSPAPVSVRFEGRLRLSRENILGSMTVLRDDFDAVAPSQGRIAHLPAFDFAFVQDGSALIPVTRGNVASENNYWEYILEPGRVWSEPADQGLARAALPFSLHERNANCMHNGVLTFLFGAHGVVSRAAYQISSETCAYFKADLWGVLAAKFTPGVVANREAALASHAREIAVRLPVKPIEALKTDYPNSDPRNFGSTEEVPAADMTAFGFVIDDTHYVGGCETRRGIYPFCEVLDLPSYSLAKGLFAGLATMRLERLYPGVMQQRISDYVPQCSPDSGWDRVTFEHALDMATGAYTSPVYDVDERSRETSEFFIAEEHALKIHIACNQHAHRAPPGSRWVYHTTDTYVLGTALSAFLQERAGGNADVYRDVLVQPLWRRLELSPVVQATRRTPDRRAQAFTGWGLVLHPDDVARFAQFLNSARGRIKAEPFFDEQSFAAAMQRDPSDRGLSSVDATFRYNNGFWAHDVSAYIGCDAPIWIPYLAGYGGINVLLLPNDTIYYYFSDGGVFRFRRAVAEANNIRPLCKAAS